MTEQQMIDLVKDYFAGVDSEDFEAIRAVLTDDCVFTVETHGVRLEGRADIEAMFRRLWRNHAAVRHENFAYVAAHAEGRIAVQFAVVNTHHDGTLAHKSNCNFFTVRGGRFCQIAVYMAGENTLRI